MKKTLTRLAAALTVLAFAAPALPCELMRQSAEAKGTAQTVAQAPRTDPKAQPQAKEAKQQQAVKKTTIATK